jgi:hypothetical protein
MLCFAFLVNDENLLGCGKNGGMDSSQKQAKISDGCVKMPALCVYHSICSLQQDQELIKRI